MTPPDPTTTTGTPTVRLARADDVPIVLALIGELADFERSAHELVASAEDLHDALFGTDPRVFCHVAEHDGDVVGFALWFLTFSTWTGRHGIHLEDLYVAATHRRLGLGRRLVLTLVDLARERGYPRIEWSVLDWNTQAQAFYRGLGAVPMTDWTTWRLQS